MAGVKGRSGPRKKPAAVHKREGTHRKDRHDGKLTAVPGAPAPPAWLTEEELVIWRDLVGQIGKVDGLLEEPHQLAIASFVEAIQELIEARREIAERGATAVSEKGGEYQHPAVGRKNKALERIRYWIARFGLSPSDKQSINAPGSGGADSNPFGEWMRQMTATPN